MAMNFQIILGCTYSGTTKLVVVDAQTSYDEVLYQINCKWPDLFKNNVNVRCDVGELCNICLESQSDLDSIRLICEFSKVKSVSVVLECVRSNCTSELGCLGGGGGYILGESLYVESRIGMVRKAVTGNLQHIHKVKKKGGKFINYQNLGGTGQPDDNDMYNKYDAVCDPAVVLLSDGWEELIQCGQLVDFCGTAAEFRCALIKFSMKTGFKFKYLRNTSELIHAICCREVMPKCNWYIKAKLNIGTGHFVVETTQETHKCANSVVNLLDASKMSSKLIGELMLTNAINNSRLKAQNVIDAMRDGYGVHVSYSKARRAAEFAKMRVFGDFAESYDLLKYYCHALRLTNPGSVVVLECNHSTNRFERLFIALNASIQGFQFCPPLLFVDGTFLRGPFKGILLVAVAKDGNKGLFPIAYGVVSVENTENWCWFLRLIRESITHPQKISYLSDRNSGLMAAFNETFDESVHFFCIYHLLANLKARFCTGLKKRQRFQYIKLFKECAYEADPMKFAAKIHDFKLIGGEKALEWLSQLPYHKWAIAFTPEVMRYGELTSNAAESFNAWILPARCLPITKMVDYIRSGMSRWYVERRVESNKWDGVLVPRKEKLWRNLSNVGVQWRVVLCPGNDYEVLSIPTTRVDLRTSSCSCHEWQSTGFPCCHAVAVIRKVRSDIVADVDSFFFTAQYKKSYSWDINPIPETLLIEIKGACTLPKIRSPVISRSIGRPKLKKRIPSQGESRVKPKDKPACLKCGNFAIHDHWTCGA